MKIPRRIWGDIRRGENIDLYLTIPAAIVIGVLNLTGSVSKDWVAPLTLVVLGFVTLTILGSRYRVEELAAKISPSVDSIFVEQFPGLEDAFRAAHDVWLVGHSLSDYADDHYSMIEWKLTQGHAIQVMTIAPDPTVTEFSEMRAYARRNKERACDEIRGSLESFWDLKQKAPTRMHIRTIRHPLGHRTVALDPYSPSGSIYVSNYPFRTAGGAKPSFVLHSKDGAWYEFYRDELKNLWEAGEEWRDEASITLVKEAHNVQSSTL